MCVYYFVCAFFSRKSVADHILMLRPMPVVVALIFCGNILRLMQFFTGAFNDLNIL